MKNLNSTFNKYFFIFFIFLLNLNNLKSQILYTDFNPNITESWGVNNPILVDINQDGVNDFKLYSNQWFQYLHQSCCSCYVSKMEVIDTTSKIAQKDTTNINNYCCNHAYLDSGIIVDNRFLWQNTITFNGEGPTPYVCNCAVPNLAKFYPVKILISGNYCYGWIRIYPIGNSLTLMDMAVNLSPEQPIETGQKLSDILNFKQNISNLIIFPNPSNNEVSIQIPEKTNAKYLLSIIDFKGKIVKNIKIENYQEEIVININNLTKGVYHFILSNGEKNYQTNVIKQ